MDSNFDLYENVTITRSHILVYFSYAAYKYESVDISKPKEITVAGPLCLVTTEHDE